MYKNLNIQKSLWEEVAETVNSSGQGPIKTSAEWKKVS